jgi:hypothetical protein
MHLMEISRNRAKFFKHLEPFLASAGLEAASSTRILGSPFTAIEAPS